MPYRRKADKRKTRKTVVAASVLQVAQGDGLTMSNDGQLPCCLVTAYLLNKLWGRPPQYASTPCKLTSDLLTTKVVSESRETWATSVPILFFLGLSVLDLGLMYATDRQTSSLSDVRRASSLNASALSGWRHKKTGLTPANCILFSISNRSLRQPKIFLLQPTRIIITCQQND